jgi:hypothetical protein
MTQNKNDDKNLVEKFEKSVEGDIVDAIVENGKLVAAAEAPVAGFDDYMLHYSDDLLDIDTNKKTVKIEAPYRGSELEGYR